MLMTNETKRKEKRKEVVFNISNKQNETKRKKKKKKRPPLSITQYLFTFSSIHYYNNVYIQIFVDLIFFVFRCCCYCCYDAERRN